MTIKCTTVQQVIDGLVAEAERLQIRAPITVVDDHEGEPMKRRSPIAIQ